MRGSCLSYLFERECNNVNVNVITRLEFELAVYDIAVKRVSYNCETIPLTIYNQILLSLISKSYEVQSQ